MRPFSVVNMVSAGRLCKGFAGGCQRLRSERPPELNGIGDDAAQAPAAAGVFVTSPAGEGGGDGLFQRGTAEV
jgi:hypothetical protein